MLCGEFLLAPQCVQSSQPSMCDGMVRLERQDMLHEIEGFVVPPLFDPVNRPRQFLFDRGLRRLDLTQLLLNRRCRLQQLSLPVRIHRGDKAVLRATRLRFTEPILDQRLRQPSDFVAAVGSRLRLMPCEQHFIPRDGMHGDAVFPFANGCQIGNGGGFKRDLNFSAARHVTADAVVLHAHRQLGSLSAIGRLMAFETGTLSHTTATQFRRLMRVVAGDTGQRVALLKALARAQVRRLVGDVIVLGLSGRERLDVRVERIARPITERGTAIPEGIAVTLRAQVHQPLAREPSRMSDRLTRPSLGMSLMKCHMLFAGTMTDFARHTENRGVAFVLIQRSRRVIHPRVMALHAARSRLA